MKKSIPALCLSLALCLAGGLLMAQQAEDPGQKAITLSGPGILNLVVYDKDKKEIGRGTAVVLAKDIAATDYHLVSQAASVVGFNFKKKEVDVLGIVAMDRPHDLALIKIDGKVEPLVPAAVPLAPEQKIIALGANESGDFVVSLGAIRSLFDLGGGVKVADTSLAVPDTFTGGAVLTEDGKLIGLLTIIERRLRFVFPIAAVTAMNKGGKPALFKTWTPEDYLATMDGMWLAGRLYKWVDEALNAQRNLEKVTKAQPDNLEAWILLSDVYNRQRDFNNAVTAFKKVIELDPKNSAAYLGLGDIQIRMQKPQEAALNLEKALALDPTKAEALMFLGNAYEDAHEWVKAAEAYEKYLALNPTNAWMTYQHLGTCRKEAGQFDQAAAAFAEALKAQPQDQSLNYKLADAYSKGGKLEQAEAVYKKLAEMSPKDAVTYYRSIMAMYDGANNPAKAIEAAKKVSELDPQNEQYIYNVGLMYQKLQKYPEAIDSYKKVLVLKPQYDLALFQAGYCYYMLKSYSEALPYFLKDVEVMADNHYGYLYIGMCYMQLKQWAKAMDPMKKASDLKPEDGTSLFNLGVIYLNLKDKYSAQEVAKKLQAIDANLAAKLRSYIK